MSKKQNTQLIVFVYLLSNYIPKFKTVSAAPVPEGYTYVVGLGCIAYVDAEMNYADARANCTGNGGDLLNLDASPNVGQLINNFLR